MIEKQEKKCYLEDLTVEETKSIEGGSLLLSCIACFAVFFIVAFVGTLVSE